MRSATTTNPRSYSQPFLALRATACAARKTGRGTVGLFDFNVLSPVPAGLVAELRSKRPPRRVERGLALRSIRKRFGDHLADCDQLVFPHDPRRLNVQVVTAGVGDLGVDRPRPLFVASSLRLGKRGLVAMEMSQVWDLLAGRQRSQRLKAEVDGFLGSLRTA